MVNVELSEEELHVIEKMRLERKEEERIRIERLEVLKVAYEYEKWLQENKVGSTYSTFCDEFGYTGKEKDWMFSVVNEIRSRAHEEVS